MSTFDCSLLTVEANLVTTQQHVASEKLNLQSKGKRTE